MPVSLIAVSFFSQHGEGPPPPRSSAALSSWWSVSSCPSSPSADPKCWSSCEWSEACWPWLVRLCQQLSVHTFRRPQGRSVQSGRKIPGSYSAWSDLRKCVTKGRCLRGSRFLSSCISGGALCCPSKWGRLSFCMPSLVGDPYVQWHPYSKAPKSQQLWFWCISKRLESRDLNRHLCTQAHSSATHNSQKGETTQVVSINR